MLTDADTFVSQVTIQGEDTALTFDYAALAQATSIEMQNLTVTDVYTTADEDSSSRGALTLTCQSGDQTVYVRTVPLYGTDGQLVTADMFTGKTINVKGIVGCYDGQYQVMVFTLNSISFNE